MAIDGVIPMTQEIFDSIMKRREEAGPVLEDLWTDVFLKYPEFAWIHAEKLAAELGVPFDDAEIPEEAAGKTEHSDEFRLSDFPFKPNPADILTDINSGLFDLLFHHSLCMLD